jgi:hypothetical protein
MKKKKKKKNTKKKKKKTTHTSNIKLLPQPKTCIVPNVTKWSK